MVDSPQVASNWQEVSFSSLDLFQEWHLEAEVPRKGMLLVQLQAYWGFEVTHDV